MALQVSYTHIPTGVIVATAYAKITSFTISGDLVANTLNSTIYVTVFVSQAAVGVKQPIDTKTYQLDDTTTTQVFFAAQQAGEPASRVARIAARMYTYIKTQTEFTGAIDV
jgi:hypothetical protein